MNPGEWLRVNNIFANALDIPTEAQSEFVQQAAAGDPTVKAEVLRLLQAMHSSGGFLEVPAVDLKDLIPTPPSPDPLLQPGTVLAGRFEIRRFLASGGMGEVYEAWDSVLREAVALKTIRPHIAQRAEVIERFRQEVRNARVISHPNICRVHELFSHDNPNPAHPGQKLWFLSMEMLEGTTLLECVRSRGKLPPKQALNVAAQLADGLYAAHAHGLVHRDFKSANVMLLEDGTPPARAVIMDFGLSHRMLKGAEEDDVRKGAGTPAYMAPEQASGGDVGPLADQYAFGIVLCEMLSGERPHFSASKKTASKRRVRLPAHHFPPRSEHVVRRCLEFDPACRFPDMRSTARALAPPGLLGTPWRIAAALLLLTALTGGLWKYREYRNRCRICDIVQLTPDNDRSESPSVSRDGKMVAYSSDRAENGNLDIFIQQLPNGQPVRLTKDRAMDSDPSLSPDATQVVFRSERDGGGIYRKSLSGAPAQLIAHQGRNPQISPDGKTVLFWTGDPDPTIASGKIYRISIDGGEPVRMAQSFQDARYPVWSPDGSKILFSGCESTANEPTGCFDWWVADQARSRVQRTHAMEFLLKRKIIMAKWSSGFWSGNRIFFSAKIGAQWNLWSIELDPSSYTATGTPQLLLEEDARDLGPSLASNGLIAYTRLLGALHVWSIDAASAKAQNRTAEPELTKITDDADLDSTPFVTENGRHLIFVRGKSMDRTLWVRDLVAGTETEIPEARGELHSPVMDSTGEWFAFSRDVSNVTSIFGGKRGELSNQLCSDCSQPTGWFDTNRALLYRAGSPLEIRMADPRNGSNRVLLHEAGASLSDASWSPANEHLLFTEVKDDKKRLYAVRVPRASGQAAGNWIGIPTQGVPDHPRWSGDGRSIFYVSNQDGFRCIYGQAFSPESHSPIEPPFAVAHFHHGRSAIDTVLPRAFNLSASGTSLYFNLGDQSSTVQVGHRPAGR